MKYVEEYENYDEVEQLASGPALPPVSQAGPASVALERCPETQHHCPGPNTKTSRESKLACMPTANHRLPVRRSVRHQNNPTSITPAQAQLVSPGLPGAPVGTRWIGAAPQARTRGLRQCELRISTDVNSS